MFCWNAEECWRELRQYCEANEDKNNFEEFDLGHGVRIVEALARQPHEYQGQIVALLVEKVHDYRHDPRKWLQPLIANLAGQMRLHDAIPPLVGNLGHPYSFMADQCMFALAKIGSDDVVAAVCNQYSRRSTDFRSWVSDLLCKIHLDSTVQRVLELLRVETDLAIRTNLYEALLDHFSNEGIEPARQLIKQHGLTPDLRHLRSSLITVCKIVGGRFPECDVWQEEANRDAEEERARAREIQKMVFEAGGDMATLVRKLQTQLAKKELERKRLEAEVAAHERLLAAKRSSLWAMPEPTKPNRIGRNDPCPCGSGKKNKACCMRM